MTKHTDHTDHKAEQPPPEPDPTHATAPDPSPATPSSVTPVTGLPASPPVPATDYTDAGVPTLDYLQDKIDKRYGTALGATELAEVGDEAQAQQRAAADREQAARDRLEEIRRSLRGDED